MNNKDNKEKENPEFSQLTIDVTRSLSKTTKKEQGIYITPISIITRLIERIKEYLIRPNSLLLEPSGGTGEFILQILKKYNQEIETETTEKTPATKIETIDIVEKNDYMYEKMVENFTQNGILNSVNCHHMNFLDYTTDKKYDIIIGNPPYIVIPNTEIPPQYKDFIIGRPNLFGLFILHSFTLLKENGIMAFIIPKSFLNTAYYASIRNYLKQNGNIIEIIDFTGDSGEHLFMDTQQETIGFIYKKGGEKIEDDYSLLLPNNNWVYSLNKMKLQELFHNSITLDKMGFSVKTGNIVWNEKKGVLTNDQSATLLLYNSNITKNTIEIKEFTNPAKKQYIKLKGSNDLVMVINRGNGNSSYKLSYAIIDMTDRPYLVENHLNIIYSKTPQNREEINKKFRQIIRSFENPKTGDFIRSFLGNNGLSKTELETIFPVYID